MQSADLEGLSTVLIVGMFQLSEQWNIACGALGDTSKDSKTTHVRDTVLPQQFMIFLALDVLGVWWSSAEPTT